ncbi:MAG: HIT family protein [Chitinivorax sp.]
MSKHANCIFCAIAAGKIPGEIIYKTEQVMVLLDAFPLRPGHLLVIPLQHAEFIEDLPAAVRDDLILQGAKLSRAAIRGGFGTPATHWLLNNGKAASQHVQHVHLHIIPRSGGDGLAMGWQFFTRFLNPFAAVGRAQRLKAQAERWRLALAQLPAADN